MTRLDRVYREVQLLTSRNMAETSSETQTTEQTVYELEYEGPEGERRTLTYRSVDDVEKDLALLGRMGRKVYALTFTTTTTRTTTSRWEP